MTTRMPWLEERYHAGDFHKCDLDVLITMDKCHASTLFLADAGRSALGSGAGVNAGLTTWTVRGYANFGWDMLPLDEEQQIVYESALLEVEFAELGMDSRLGKPVLEWEQSASMLGRYSFMKQYKRAGPLLKFYIFLPHEQMREFSEISRSCPMVVLELQAEVYVTADPVVAEVDPDLLLPIPQFGRGRRGFNIVRVTSISCEHDEPFELIVP